MTNAAMVLLLPLLVQGLASQPAVAASRNSEVIRAIEALAKKSQEAKPRYREYDAFLLKTGICTESKGPESSRNRACHADVALVRRKDWEKALELVSRYPGAPVPYQEGVRKILELRDPAPSEKEAAVAATGALYPGAGIDLLFLQRSLLDREGKLKLSAADRAKATKAILALTEQATREDGPILSPMIQAAMLRSLIEGGFLAAAPDAQAGLEALDQHIKQVRAKIDPSVMPQASPSPSMEAQIAMFLEGYQEETRQSAVLRKELKGVLEKLRRK